MIISKGESLCFPVWVEGRLRKTLGHGRLNAMQIFANGIFIIPLVFLLVQRIEDGKHGGNADRLIVTNNCFEQSVL